MSEQLHPANPAPNGGYERTDIGVRGVLYFLAGLAVFGALAYLAAAGAYSYLDKRSAAEQAPVNPLVTNAPADTRHISKDYPQGAFPNPKLEEDERGQLNGIRLNEEETLSTYDYIDKNAGTIRIPIDRAMDLISQRGLPVRAQASAAAMPAPESTHPEKKKAKK
ncbi:MAG TPA: hypothetical protein VK812_15300 [Candidatus Binatus sp.]|nr:hypothetical protein [Candidatus Binatus sp.]